METKTQNTDVLVTKRTDIMLVDPRNITVEEGFNVRKDMGDLEGLAHSVVTDGVIVPIEGYKVRSEDRYVLTDGHRRLAAVKLALKFHAEGKAGFEDVSKIQLIRLIPSSANIKDRLYIMAITGEKKKDLTDLEKAEMYAR
jgi:ParB family chromosome partitioning protein